ncbi:ParB/RepB/Spo0J family partition protein [Deinococcus sp. NW-56]|uniref:ParB/RepB/Spo0J family partition protein n=1 Tax=Deinococcus sp. NW-56 TaxID=2080419 RepID=UPI00131A2D06|nr:ParB/RepB/Spo0J family partition protein [Deinococcus sp. NW-56]
MTARAYESGQRVQVVGEGAGEIVQISVTGRHLIQLDDGPRVYREAGQLSPVRLEDLLMTQTTPAPMKKGRKPAPAPDPYAEAGISLTTRYDPTTFVVARIEGESAEAMCTAVSVNGDLRLTFRNGEERYVPHTDCRLTSLPPRAPLRRGDRVTCVDAETFPGQYDVKAVGGESVEASPISGGYAEHGTLRTFQAGALRVYRRANPEDARADLGLDPASPEGVQPEAPASAEGWMFPNNSHLAHWGDGQKVLCGRYVPQGTPVIGSDLFGYADRRCTKCAKALARRTGEAAPTTEALEDRSTPESQPLPEIREPILRGADVRNVALAALHPSPLNPRKHFDEAKLTELAESIAHQGLMQNLVVRANTGEGGGYEVIAGGRRLRALRLLADQGRVNPANYMVPIRVQPLDDLQALMLATAENADRADVSPLEEADAYAGMVALGASEEDIALRFGRSVRHVHQRLVLSRDLGDDARALLNEGKIGIGQAQVIAQTSGPLRKHVVKNAVEGLGPERLRDMVKGRSFLVEHARFDVQASGLEVIEDLFGSTPARFADPQAALALQIEWVEARAEKLRAKGKHHFVDVMGVETSYLSLPWETYSEHHGTAYKHLSGIVLRYSTTTGEVKEYSGVARQADIRAHKKGEKQAEAAAKGEPVRPLPEGTFVAAHEYRARALRGRVLGDGRLALVATVHGLLSSGGLGKIRIQTHTGHRVSLAALPEHAARAVDLLGGHYELNRNHLDTYGIQPTSGQQDVALFDHLCTLETDDLLFLLSLRVAHSVYEWEDYNLHLQHPLYDHLAGLTDANALIAEEFRLTDEWLKRYPREHLTTLAQEAGLGRAIVEDAPTLKEARARILEHADRLHAEGFVPALVRFSAAD